MAYWALESTVSIIKNFFDEKASSNTQPFLIENEYFNLITLNIADLLEGFLILFIEKQMKTKKEEEIKKTKNTQELIYNDYSIKRNKFVYIFTINIFNFFFWLVVLIFCII